jgi:hypothetical protein
MESSNDPGPSDDKQPPVEHHLGPKLGSGPPDHGTQPMEPVGTPSVDDTISFDGDVCR